VPGTLTHFRQLAEGVKTKLGRLDLGWKDFGTKAAVTCCTPSFRFRPT
jgi:hypothetical protein